MVPGSRGITRCKTAVSSTIRLRTQEPLLFLYPAWARGIQSSAAPVANNERYPVADAAPYGHDIEGIHPLLEPPDHPRPNRGRPPTTRERSCSNRRPDTQHPHDAASKPLPRRMVGGIKIRRMLAQCDERSKSEEIKQMKRNEYAEQIREARRRESLEDNRAVDETEGPSPKKIMDNLLAHTPLRKPASALPILVPDASLQGLLFGEEDNILKIKQRTGCEIDLLDETRDDGMRTLRLTGERTCVATAAVAIIKAIPGATSKTRPHALMAKYSTKDAPAAASDGTIKARPVLSKSKESLGRIPRRADELPWPETWTAESLHLYVTDLTRMPMPNQIHRVLYKPGEEHLVIVMEILRDILDSDECLEAMDVVTVNEIIGYSMVKGQIRLARDIYYKVQLHGMRLSTETYNIMLRGAAKVKDLDTFAQLTQAMVNRNYRPDAGTWLAFLALLDGTKGLMKAVAGMRERGLFQEPRVASRACEIVAPHLLQQRLKGDNPPLFSHFEREMYETFGRDWLTLSGANKLLRVFSRRGLLSESWKLFEYMTQRGITPDTLSGNTMVDACIRFDDLTTGLDLLERLMRGHGFSPDELTWGILFKHAWSEKYYATCRSIWLYACVKGCVSYLTRSRVLRSLRTSFTPSTAPATSTTAAEEEVDEKDVKSAPNLDVKNAMSDTNIKSEDAAKDEDDNEDVKTENVPHTEQNAPLPVARTSWADTAGRFIVNKDNSALDKIWDRIHTERSDTSPETVAHAAASLIIKNDTDLFLTHKTVEKHISLIRRSLKVDLQASKRPSESFEDRMKWVQEHAPTPVLILRRGCS